MKRILIPSLVIIAIGIVLFLLLVNKDTINESKDFSPSLEVGDLMNKAEMYYRKEELEVALGLYNEIILMDSTIAKAYYNRAYCFAELEYFKDANKDYYKSIELNHKVANSFFNLGCNYLALLDDSTALYCFRKAYELNSNDEKAKFQIDILNSILSVESCIN